MNDFPFPHKPWLAAAILAATLATTGCSAEISSQERFDRAQVLQNEGDYRAAVLEYKLILQKEPDNIAARWALGQAYLELGDGAGAEKELKYAQSKGKEDDEIKLALAQAYLLRSNYKEALEALDSSSTEQSSPLALVVRGEAEIGIQDLSNAKKRFLESLRKEKTNPLAHRGLAKIALMEKEFDDADYRLDLALEQSDQDAQSWMLKGEVALSKRDAVKAEEYFRKSVNLDDNSFSARVGLVRALLEQQKTDQTKEHIDFLAKSLPDHPLVNYLTAVAAKQSNNLENAKSALYRVRSVKPDHLPSMLLLGSVHYLLNEFELATQQLSQYLNSDPTHLPARKLLAASYLKLNTPGRAIEILEPAEKEFSGDVQFLSMLGNAHIANGNYTRGMSYLERAVDLEPQAMEIRLRLASGQLAKGDPDKAIAELNTAIEIDPDFLQAEIMLGLIHLKRGEFDKTLESARALVAKKPRNPLPYNLMAAAYEGKKDIKQARATYETALSVSSNYIPALLNLARLDLQANDRKLARQRFESVLEFDKNNEQALLGLAKIVKDEARYQDALQLLDRARWHNPAALQPRLILAGIYLQENNPKKALELITEAEKLAPNEPRVLVLLGQSQLATGSHSAGRKTFEKLVELNPQSTDAYFKLSIAQLAGKDVAGAKASLQRAITLDSAYLPARVALGNLELETGNAKAAERIAKLLMSEHPESAAGYVLQGDLWMRDNRAADAKKSYQTAYKLSPNRPLLIKLFKAEEASGDSDQATARLRNWVETNPKDIAVRLALAQSLQQNGKDSEAIREYESVLQLQQNNVVALNNLSGLYLGSDNIRSLELAKRAHDLAPESADVLDTYGWVLIKSGDLQQGLRILKTAVLSAPNNRDIKFHLAAARAQTGEREQAKNDLQALLADNKPFAERAAAAALLKELQ